MKKFFDLVKPARQPRDGILSFLNYIPSRGARYQANIKWVMPAQRKFFDPACTGDLAEMPAPNWNSIYLPYKDSKELETADEKVRKIFSLGYQTHRCTYEMYNHELIEKVKSHAYDTDSKEFKIANISAKIRFIQPIIAKRPSKCGPLRRHLYRLIRKRKYLLHDLRVEDYKKFEWLLEKLDLEYRTRVEKENKLTTREQCLDLLARLKVAQVKEERLAALRKELDDQKVAFLEKKIKKLIEIRQTEEKNNLTITVTEKDIEDCRSKLEEVKVQIAERTEKGYKRKIHPFFLEAFDEKLLWKKEKEGEKIREQITYVNNRVAGN